MDYGETIGSWEQMLAFFSYQEQQEKSILEEWDNNGVQFLVKVLDLEDLARSEDGPGKYLEFQSKDLLNFHENAFDFQIG